MILRVAGVNTSLEWCGAPWSGVGFGRLSIWIAKPTAMLRVCACLASFGFLGRAETRYMAVRFVHSNADFVVQPKKVALPCRMRGRLVSFLLPRFMNSGSELTIQEFSSRNLRDDANCQKRSCISIDPIKHFSSWHRGARASRLAPFNMTSRIRIIARAPHADCSYQDS